MVKYVTWQQRITNEVLCAGLPRISTAIRERCLRFSGHCWRSKNEVVCYLVLWESKHSKRSIGGQARTFVDLLKATPRFPGTACRQQWMTGLAGEREPWGVDRGGPSSSSSINVVL